MDTKLGSMSDVKARELELIAAAEELLAKEENQNRAIEEEKDVDDEWNDDEPAGKKKVRGKSIHKFKINSDKY